MHDEVDDDVSLGPSLNDLLSSDDLIDYNMTNPHHPISDRPYLFARSRVRNTIPDSHPLTSQELGPYARYYSSEILPRGNSHGDNYAASTMRYSPR